MFSVDQCSSLLISVLQSLVPKNGHTARVLAVTRVSDPREGKQDIRSLRDQRMLLDDFLRSNVDVPYEVVANDCAGKGELIDRKNSFS